MPADRPNPWRGREPLYFTLAPIVDLLARILARMRVTGQERIPRSGPVIVAANHTSHLDPIILLSVLHRCRRRPRFLAVSGLWELRLVGWLLRKGRMIPVVRGAGAEPMVRAARRALDADQVVVIYPEGTIVRSATSSQARPGAGLLALDSGAPVLPVLMQGVPPWTGRLPRLRSPVDVHVGPPVDLSGIDARQGLDASLAASRAILDSIRDLGARRR